MKPTKISSVALPVRFARAVLLFHRGGAWTVDDHHDWRTLTGMPLATIQNVCRLARQVEEEAGNAMAAARVQAFREAEAVCRELDSQECVEAIQRLRRAHDGID